MVKSTRRELSALRAEVFERAGHRCEWPACEYPINEFNRLELAHLSHRGMGGSRSVNTADLCRAFCTYHHDALDGRTGLGNLRQELRQLLLEVT